jgi:AcrR family transcriptional regulator
MKKRPYQQRLRAEAAEETRQRILDVLYERLREAPSKPVSVDEIARRARVSRSTVYVVFGSRSGLFDALTERLLAGAGYKRIVEAVGRPDARESLRGAIEGGVEMYAAHHDVFRVLSSMAKLDPDGVGQAIDRSERKRALGIANQAKRLHEQGVLRPGLSPNRAAHVIWLLASFAAFDVVATGRQLSREATARILVEIAERALYESTVADDRR